MSENLLKINELCVDYATDSGLVRAVNAVSFEIDQKNIFGLAGESGCGKSTIAFAIARLTKPPGFISSGEILFNNEDVLAFNKERLRSYRWAEVSVVFQSAMNALNPVITVGEQITDTIFAHRREHKKVARDRAAELLRLVGIHPDRLNDFPHQFSGGMRQRIGIAISLVLNPKLIIMDEPTTALDVVVQREIMQEIYELKEQFGFSILFITHDLSLMVEFSDTIGIMYAAELVEVAPANQILAKPLHPYTEALSHSYPTLSGPKVRLSGIPGNPLNLNQIPDGCRFQDRCHLVHDKCYTEAPKLVKVKPDHSVRCHLY